MSTTKRSDAAEVAKTVGLGLGVPLVGGLALTKGMGDSLTEIPNPHQKGGTPIQLYKPVADATKRVADGQGSMLDYMKAYRHPGQVQAHPLYGVSNRLGRGLLGGLRGYSKALGDNGPWTGAGLGSLSGVGMGLLGNAIMRGLGRSDMPYWKAALLGAGIGGVVGGGGAHYRGSMRDRFLKGAAALEKEEEEDSDQAGIIPAALATGAGGAGALGLSYALMSDGAATRALDQFKQYDPKAFLDNAALPEGHTELTYYQKMLSPAAQLTMFGKPVGDALVKLRSSEDLMKQLGTEAYTLKDTKAQEGASGRQHYDMFARGPVAAYAHQMKAKYHDTDVPEALGVIPGTKYTDWMGRKFEDFVAEKAGQRINPYEVTTNFMDPEEQAALMVDFHKSLTPEEQAYKLQVEDLPGDKYIKQTGNYMPKAESYVNMRNKLKELGGSSAGAALGGILGHALHDQARGETEDGEEKRDWKYWVSVLGGSGLGGYAGNKLTKKLMDKSSAWRGPGMDDASAQREVSSIVAAIRTSPGLSFNQRAQLMSGVGQLDATSAKQLHRVLVSGGGAAVGAIVARFLMGKGMGSTVLGALVGGVLGNAVFGSSGARTPAGNPGMNGTDFSGRSF